MITKKYYVCLDSDHDYNGRSIGEYLTLEEAELGIWYDWSTLCDNDKKYYSKQCFYYEIRIIKEHEDGEIETIEIIDTIHVDDIVYDII